MSAQLDVNEILDFAILMEQKGYEFYTESAKKFNDLKLTQLFHLLAEQEFNHERIFKKMKEKTGSLKSTAFNDKVEEIQMKDYLGEFLFGKKKSLKEKIKTFQSIEEVIQLAFGIEKDSVVFYTALKNYVDNEHEAVIENIIQEEVSHVLRLQKFKTEEIPPPPDVDAL
jgi:rubrerythrin